MSSENKIELISDVGLIHYIGWIIIGSIMIVSMIVAFFIPGIILVTFLYALIFFTCIYSAKKIEIDKKSLQVKVSSYFWKEYFLIRLTDIGDINKSLPGTYSFKYKDDNGWNSVRFHSLDFELKFMVPLVVFFQHNSDVEYFSEMVKYAKKLNND